MHLLLALLLAFGCSTPRSAPSQNRPLPSAKGRTLVIRDCASAPRAPKVDEDAPAVIDATDLDDVTVSLVMHKEELLLAVDGNRGATAARTKMHSLYRGGNVDDAYPVAVLEEGQFLSAFLPEGGTSHTEFRVRLSLCSIEVLRGERDDLSNETPWFIYTRVSIAPGRSVWARPTAG